MKENVTAEVFPTLRNISLSRRTFVACAAIAAAQAALVSAGCAPEVQPSGEGLASTAAFAPGTYTASAPGKKGPVTVEVRMSENAIESVEIVEFEDTERISAPAREREADRGAAELERRHRGGRHADEYGHHRGRG